MSVALRTLRQCENTTNFSWKKLVAKPLYFGWFHKQICLAKVVPASLEKCEKHYLNGSIFSKISFWLVKSSLKNLQN